MRAPLLTALLLLVSTGCTMLDPSSASSGEQTYSVDPSQPFVVVTVGGSPAATPTSGSVAETVPESTPLPRIVLPTPDPANAPTPRPVASPSLSRGGQASAQAAAQAQRASANPAPASSPAAAARTP